MNYYIETGKIAPFSYRSEKTCVVYPTERKNSKGFSGNGNPLPCLTGFVLSMELKMLKGPSSREEVPMPPW
jgi:hypothetical protein